jgi:putative membrane protein
MSRRSIALLGVGLALALAPSADAASVDDALFADNATRSNLAEIATSRLALDKSKDAGVRAYARRMIRDHTTAQRKLAAIAKALDTSLPKRPSALQLADAARLARFSGDEFDTLYVRRQVVAHRKALATMLLELDTGTTAQLRNYAATTRPVVTMHLTMAKALRKSL